jgi:hypothetical protein
MQSKPSFDLCEWQGAESAPWEKQSFCFVSDIDVVSVCNDYIHRHVNLIETPVRLLDSYRSYLIQVLKDVDYLIGKLTLNQDSLTIHTNYVVDVSLAKAQPWRFTAYALKFISSRLNSSDIESLVGASLWLYIDPILNEAFENGSLFRLEKYIKVGHVLMDMSFDIGWDSLYAKPSQLKVIEGLTANPERAATLRELALYIARNFWIRNYQDAAKQILYIGFADIPDVITTLKDNDLQTLLIEMNSKQAVHTLFSDQMMQSAKNLNCNQIVEGALRIIGGERAS